MLARVVIALLIALWCCICAQGRRGRIQVRLEGGPQPYAGRVMVYYGPFRSRPGIWGSVCDNGWSKKNAAVVCRQLGYKGVVLATKGQFFGRQDLYEKIKIGSRIINKRTRILLDRVACNGREYNIGDCGRSRWGQVRCNRLRLAGVMCDPGIKNLIKTPPLHSANKDIDIKKFQLSLLPKTNKSEEIITEGALLVKYKGRKTGVICSDNWGMKEARVACGQLGFNHALKKPAHIRIDNIKRIILKQTPVAEVAGFHLGNVSCTGNEATLLSCNSSGLRKQTCSSGLAVWLKCETKVPTFAHARLLGGVQTWEGRVEVRKRMDWATVCDKDMDIYTANIICRTLGYGTAKEYALGTVYPHAMDNMKMYENIACTGKETNLQNCRWTKRKRDYPCRHYSDAGVRCNVPERQQKDRMKIRLTGNQYNYIGKIEVKIKGKWGVICGDRWTMKNSMVVCRELGYGYATANYSTKHFGKTGKVLISGVTCLGHETSLDECLRHSNLNCSQTKRFAAVRCSKVAPDLLWDIQELTKTMSVRLFPIISLRCAHEENCLSSSADSVFGNIQLRRELFAYQRRLLRFSAKVHNVGTAAYRPYLQKNAWIWHSCHRHYHSDEQFALYDLIDPHTHEKIAEGHKASYCLEDTKCDDGVDQVYFCRGGGDQGISVNCHDNYEYTLDCQWVDITDLINEPNRSYKLRLVANPSFKVGESDYSNNVVLCDITDRRTRIQVWKCFQETCENGVRSHHGNGNFACCRFPFIYDGKSRDTCVLDETTGQFWCATSENFDKDKRFGYC